MTSFAPRLRLLAFTTTLVFAGATFAPAAHADPESDAKDLFQRGRDLRQKGDCSGAVTFFRKAIKIYPNGLGSIRNLAECEEQLGHYASSKRAWLDLKRALITAPNDPKYEGWDKDAEDAAHRLAPRVAQITVDITVKTPDGEGPANDKSGVDLLVNGEALPPNLIGTPLERDPGDYTIRVQAPDAQPVEQRIALAAGDSKRIALRIVRTPKPGGGEDDPVAKRKSRRTLGVIVGGVGALVAIGGGVAGILWLGAKSDLKTDCPDYDNPDKRVSDGRPRECPKSTQSIIDRGQTLGTLAPVLGIVGAAGMGIGAAIFLTAPSADGSAQGKGLTITPGLGRLDATWRF
jgi:hypothetical protein